MTTEPHPSRLRPPASLRAVGRERSGTPRSRHKRGFELAGVLALVGTLALFAFGGASGSLKTLPGLLVLPLLLICIVPLLAKARREETDFDLAGLLLLSFSLNMAAAYPRFQEAKDAIVYFQEGRDVVAPSLRSLSFVIDTGRDVPGTGTLRYATGAVNVLTSDTIFATFLIFSFFSFLGLYLFYRAFCTGIPEGDRKRYALLVFLWPSLVFWPSSIGKEAWMVFALGAAAWGAARLFDHQRGGLTVVVAGVAAAALVRPHVALIVGIAVVCALLFRRSEEEAFRRFVAKIVVIVLLLVGGSILTTQTAEFLELENLGSESVTVVLDETQEQTTQGGSSFDPARVRTPLDYPFAVVTVVLRPFPFEATGAEARLSSLESLALLTLLVFSIRRLAAIPRLWLRRPYLTFCLAYVAVFAFAFSVVGNFGILARQRIQVLPFVLVLLALPRVTSLIEEKRDTTVTS